MAAAGASGLPFAAFRGRERLGIPGRGPTRVFTDLGILAPDQETRELLLTYVHPGVSVQGVREATGWPLRLAEQVAETPLVALEELEALRGLRGQDVTTAGD